VEAGRSGGAAAFLAYTTSSGLHFNPPLPLGVHSFDAAQARGLGQERAFRLDLRRLAFLPLTSAWFPELSQPGRGIVGRAPAALRRVLDESFAILIRRSPAIIERLGPGWR
jgi:hypothetical protein